MGGRRRGHRCGRGVARADAAVDAELAGAAASADADSLARPPAWRGVGVGVERGTADGELVALAAVLESC